MAPAVYVSGTTSPYGCTEPSIRDTYPRTVPGFRDPRQDRSVFRGSADDLAVWWKTAGLDGHPL
jgi:hypothetical protein